VDKILTRTVDGKDMPVFMKKELTDQIPGLKKQNLRNREYATKSIQDLFEDNVIRQSTVKVFDFSSSIIAISKGDGNFTINRLPDAVQFSSVNAILCYDVNGDTLPDLLLAGNMSDFPPQFGRLDASAGQLLLNEGKKGLQLVDVAGTGLDVDGETRSIVAINRKKKKTEILFLRNNDFPVAYQVK
jgi:hypothetical protein